jgi:hypothetical protein
MKTISTSDLDGLKGQYRAKWFIWLSRRAEMVCATRRRDLTNAELYAGLWTTLISDDVDQLVAALDEQTQRETTCRSGEMR